MNIVFITPELPYPPNSGGRIYTWERLKQLKAYGNKIFLFGFCNKSDSVNLDKLYEICEEVTITCQSNKLKLYMTSLIKFYLPFFVTTYYNRLVYNKIQDTIEKNLIDIIIIDMPEVILSCPMDNGIPKVITQHNIEYKLFRSISKNSNNLFKKVKYFIESIKMEAFEKRIYKSKKINGYVFISKDDMLELREVINLDKYICIPPGYAITELNQQDQRTNCIMFSGKMDYAPNVQAVQWFVNKVFPHIKHYIPDVEFYIVGKNPTKEVRQLERQEGVIVTGTVDDMSYYLKQATVYVIPLNSGSGVKIKLFEALGYGNIVISTPKGVEGTDFINKKHLIIADDEKEFANKCINVLRDREKYKFLVHNSIEHIKNNYSWSNIGKYYNEFLTQIVQNSFEGDSNVINNKY